MGRDKASLPLGGGTFLSRLAERYRTVFPVYVSVGQPGKYPDIPELVDLRPGIGPLAGLEAAFVRTDADMVFLTATDLPFGTPELAEKLAQRLGNADACVICRNDGQPEPAFAVYRRSCLAPVQALLDQGRRAVRGLYERIQVRWVPESELEEPLDILLQNINTPEEYERARQTLENIR